MFTHATVPFPDGYAATVHLNWLGKGFELLGMLSNERPSAIFRLRGTVIPADVSSVPHAAFSAIDETANLGPVALIGISVEPIDAVLAQCATLNSSSAKTSAVSKPVDATLMAERVAKNLFNYLSSFASGSGPDSTVTLGAITKWYEYFMSKVKTTGLGFLETSNE